MQSSFSPEVLSFLELVSSVVENEKVYLVGGILRDILGNFESKTVDLDFVVIGSAVDFSKKVASLISPKKIETFEFYQTTKLLVENSALGPVIDFASGRKEFYPEPGVKPEINAAGSIEEDLARRDFSVNALALSLNKENYFTLIDLFQGKKDLASRELRILHKKSFQDDPARMLRAVRLMGRLGFKLESDTNSAFVDARPLLSLLGKRRYFEELKKLCLEEQFLKIYLLLIETKLINFIAPKHLPYGEFVERLAGATNYESRIASLFAGEKSDKFREFLKEAGIEKSLLVRLLELQESYAF